METKCVVCHDRPAQFRCIQCHKPVCDECAFKTEHGAFCSRECAAEYRDYKKTAPKAGTAGGSGLFRKLLMVIVLAVIVILLAHGLGWITLPGLPQM